jgi:quercetin dioxygenase-like cupin family protein
MADLYESDALTPMQAWNGVTVRLLSGERMTMAIAELGPNALVPRHQHDNEQIGTVIQGSARFVTDTESYELHAGGTYRLPGGTPHEVTAGADGAVFVECFSPPRSDWDSLPAAPSDSLRWPTAR